ncbi:hypothetical protein X777_12955, partial [Ooceraea biroi]
NIKLHVELICRFPKKEKIRQLWLDILELSAESVPVGGRICSAHFSEDAFDLSTGTRRLRPNIAESVPVGGRSCSAHFSEDAFDLSTGTRKLRPNTLPYKGIIYCFLILVYI